jgi:hypothetical protein
MFSTLPVASALLSVHHGPLAFAGFAFVALLYINFYLFVLDKRIEKLHRILRILIQIIYVVFASLSLYWLLLTKKEIPEETEIKNSSLYNTEKEVDKLFVKEWDMGHFDFRVIHIGNDYPPEESYAILQFHHSEAEIKLFDCHPALTDMGAEPEKLFDNIYAFPYHTGGNYSRSSGIEIFRVTSDSVKYIGLFADMRTLTMMGTKNFMCIKLPNLARARHSIFMITLPWN